MHRAWKIRPITISSLMCGWCSETAAENESESVNVTEG